MQTACFANPKVIPANLLTTDGKAIASVYGAMERQAVSYTDTPKANNALYQQPNPFDFRQQMLRLDYRVNKRHTLYGRYIYDYSSVIDPF